MKAILFALMLAASLVSVSVADLDDDSGLDGPYNEEIINSLPKMPSTTEKSTAHLPKLQIGIKKKVEDCKVKARKGYTLHMHYRGMLKDNNSEFDNSYKRGQPLTFVLGQGSVIKGWDQGLLGICAGEKRKLIIPPHLAYGDMGSPPTIPPQSTLVFEVEAVKIDTPTTGSTRDEF